MSLTDCMYQEKKEEEDLPAEDSVDSSIQRHDYMKKRGEKLITTTRNNTKNKTIKRTKITRKRKWEEE